MANVFETALLSRRSAVATGVRPQLSDPIFWSEILMSKSDAQPYVLVTDNNDVLVDEFNNQFIAST